MEQYRVLLVDDEEEIRMGIGRKTDWNALGFQLVGEAENGAEALELAEQLRPDVVLTDINMPFMDGLELCRRLSICLPAAKMVVFSGFDDFEYARQAIGMNISKYILKPINAPELRQVLQTLREQLDQQRAERRDVEALRLRYEESLPVLRELFFTRLLDGRIHAEQLHQRAERYDIDLTQSTWLAVLVEVDSGDEQEGMSRDEVMLLSVRAFFQEQFSLAECACHPLLYNDRVALVATLGQDVTLYSFLEEMGRICTLAQSLLGLELTAGLGRPHGVAHELHLSASEARSALDYRILSGSGRVIYLGDVEPNRSVRLTFDEGDERALTSAVKLGTVHDVQELVPQFMERIRDTGLTLPQCQFFVLELTTCLIKLARAGGIEPESVFGQDFTGVVRLSDFRSTKELGAWCTQHCLRIQELLSRQRTDSAGRTVERARDFIGNNFANCELNVDTLCSHLHLSPAYFSTLFKRETGMSFTAYVTNVRMEFAAELLGDTEEKTYLIAERTGYLDPNYFSYVFKRHFGVSPSKYRSGRATVVK